MKKRLLSLLVAISMVLTFLPVSALTAAAAEDSSNGELKIGQNCYPVLDNIPHQTVNGHDIYTGDGWTYDADENCKILTLCPSAPTNYDFFAIHVGHSITTDCNLVIGENATVTDGNFMASVTNNGTIKGGIFKDAVTNHGTIIGGRFFSSVTNESDGIIENGQFGDWASSRTVTNNGGTINGGTFKDELTGSGIEPGYTLTAINPIDFIDVSVNGYRNSCYIIPNQTYHASVRIVYVFDHTSGSSSLPPLVVTIDSAQHMLLSDWCVSDLKIEFEDIRGVYEVTFTAPPANGSTVTISPLTRLVIEKSGDPAVAQDWNGNRANYTGDGWKFENNSLILEPTAEKSYDFTSPDLNPHRVAVNCSVAVNSNATITNGIFLKEVTGSALNGVFLKVPNGYENSAKKITVSDNGKITALKMSGDTTALDSAANELYVVGQPTGTLYVTLSSGKVREVQLPLTADLELQLNDPAPKPEPEPETYTLKVVGGSFTTGGSDALTSGTVPVDAEAKVTLNPDAVPEGMVFDQWTISEESLLGNPNVAYNAESFTIPANAVENGKTVTVEAQYREASIEDDGPGILETAAMIGVAGTGAAVLGYTGYMIGTELYLNTVLPAGAAIPNNAGELALLLWEAAGTPAPAALLPADAAPVQQALAWGHREPAPRPGCVCGGFRQPLGGYSELESAEGVSGEPSQSKLSALPAPPKGEPLACRPGQRWTNKVRCIVNSSAPLSGFTAA